ncbi:MAG: RNA polymerase sigma factor SigI [Bacillota bacterium]|nr:RNA polymerase sigma factor SigI [Bacillota bacterium]
MVFIFTVYNSDGELAGQIIDRIKKGDVELRDKFIKDYIPFVLKVISNASPGKEGLRNSDEYSIGLIAFNEAIDKFEIGRSVRAFNFFSFAEQIIRRRIIDYIRVVSKRSKEIPFSYLEEHDSQFDERYMNGQSYSRYERIELFQEIKSFDKELKAFGIKLRDLSKYTPKHSDSREMCVKVGRKIAQNKEIFNKIINKKYFPMKELSRIVDVHPRTIERNREFIISVSIIYGNDYEHLQAYLGSTICGRGKNA